MAQAAQRLGQRLAARGPQLLSGETGRERGGTEGTGRDWGGPGENRGGGREPSLTPPVLPRPPPSCRGVLQASPGHVLVLRQGGAGAADPRRDPQGHRQHEGAGQELPDRPPGADHRQGNPPGVSGPYQALIRPSPALISPIPGPDLTGLLPVLCAFPHRQLSVWGLLRVPLHSQGFLLVVASAAVCLPPVFLNVTFESVNCCYVPSIANRKASNSYPFSLISVMSVLSCIELPEHYVMVRPQICLFRTVLVRLKLQQRQGLPWGDACRDGISWLGEVSRNVCGSCCP